MVAAGVAIGVAGAVGAGRFLASLLFGVPPYDGFILAIAAIALFSTGFAGELAARRARRRASNPMVSLRSD